MLGTPASSADDLAHIERKLDKLTHDYSVEEIIGKRQYLSARAELERRRNAALRALHTTTDTRTLAPFTKGDNLTHVWEQLDLDQRRGVLKALIDRIVIAPAKKSGGPFEPDRVDVEWCT